MKVGKLLLMAAVLGVFAWAVARQPTAQQARTAVRWGVNLDSDRPFYPVGGSVRARYSIANYSRLDGYGWSNNAGANGCEYTFTVVDSLGQVVWEPVGVFCLAVILNKDLPQGATISGANLIPLIYQNTGGIGVQGTNLPAGTYNLCVSVKFNGPHRVSGTIQAGEDYSACIPIRIEP